MSSGSKIFLTRWLRSQKLLFQSALGSCQLLFLRPVLSNSALLKEKLLKPELTQNGEGPTVVQVRGHPLERRDRRYEESRTSLGRGLGTTKRVSFGGEDYQADNPRSSVRSYPGSGVHHSESGMQPFGPGDPESIPSLAATSFDRARSSGGSLRSFRSKPRHSRRSREDGLQRSRDDANSRRSRDESSRHSRHRRSIESSRGNRRSVGSRRSRYLVVFFKCGMWKNGEEKEGKRAGEVRRRTRYCARRDAKTGHTDGKDDQLWVFRLEKSSRASRFLSSEKSAGWAARPTRR